MLNGFWQTLESKLQNGPKKIASSMKWELGPRHDQMDAADAWLWCCPRESCEQKAVLGYSIEHYYSPSEYSIYFGVAWGDSPVRRDSKVIALPAVQELRSHLAKHDFKHTRWYLGWKTMGKEYHNVDEFLTTYAKAEATTFHDIESEFWDLARKTYAGVVDANEAIKRNRK